MLCERTSSGLGTRLLRQAWVWLFVGGFFFATHYAAAGVSRSTDYDFDEARQRGDGRRETQARSGSEGRGLRAPFGRRPSQDRLIVRTRADHSTVNLSYDADGLRTRKTILNASGQLVSSTAYLLDTNNLTGYAQVVEETTTDATGTTRKTYTYGADLLSVERVDPNALSETRFFLYDGGGSVRALADETGAITDHYTYDAFGVLLVHLGTSDNAYLYRGEQYDPDLGLYYLRARFMNPDSGRFWNQDTYEGSNSDPASLHKYNYGNADPVNYFDPTGHFSLGELQMVQNVQARLNKMAISNVRVVGKNVVRRIVCITAQGVVRNGPIHHMATNKNFVGGKQFSKKFADLFDQAGIDLNSWVNKLGVPGHKGPHPDKYHEEILELLTDGLSSVSIEGLAADAAQEVLQEALQNALIKIAGRLCNANDPLTKLIAP